MVLEKDRKAPAKGSIGKQAHDYSAEENAVHRAAMGPEKRTEESTKKISHNLEEKWKQKPMHGQYPRMIAKDEIDAAKLVV